MAVAEDKIAKALQDERLIEAIALEVARCYDETFPVEAVLNSNPLHAAIAALLAEAERGKYSGRWQCWECGTSCDSPLSPKGTFACQVCGAFDLCPEAVAVRVGTAYDEERQRAEKAEAALSAAGLRVVSAEAAPDAAEASKPDEAAARRVAMEVVYQDENLGMPGLPSASIDELINVCRSYLQALSRIAELERERGDVVAAFQNERLAHRLATQRAEAAEQQLATAQADAERKAWLDAYMIAHTVKSRMPPEQDTYRHGWYDACLETMKKLIEKFGDPQSALAVRGEAPAQEDTDGDPAA